MTDLFYKIYENLKKFEKKKIELMINRLKIINFLKKVVQKMKQKMKKMI